MMVTPSPTWTLQGLGRHVSYVDRSASVWSRIGMKKTETCENGCGDIQAILKRLDRRAQRLERHLERASEVPTITLQETATLLERDYRSIIRYVRDGSLETVYEGGRWPRVPLAGLPKVMEKGRRVSR